MTSPFTENEITRKLTEVLEYDFRVSPAEANHTQIYKALSKIVETTSRKSAQCS